MNIVIGIVIAAVIGLGLLLAYVRAVSWAKESRTTRFTFEDRDTYLFLKLERPLGSDDSALVTMRTLREALRLKLEGAGYARVLIETSGLRIANRRAFWLLIGALGPALMNEKVKVAVVCGRRTPSGKHLRESGILNPLPSVREGERYLRSDEPRQAVLLDPGQADSFLAPERRKAA